MYEVGITSNNRRGLALFEAGLKLAPENPDLLAAAAVVQQNLGRWEAALPHLAKLTAIDPRSAIAARRTASTLLWLRRYTEARIEADRALSLAPTNLQTIQLGVMLALAQGDLARARWLVRTAMQRVEPAALLAHLAQFWDLYWVLDDMQQQELLILPPSAFDNDRATWAVVRAQTYDHRENPTLARVYADSARQAVEEQLRANPTAAALHTLHGVALAYLGRKNEAIEAGERGVAAVPISRDAYAGSYYQHQLARIYLLVGEPEKAVGQLGPLLRIPYYLSREWVRIDPTFATLRGNPRFERLIQGTS
jgi:tetratricopeptide (TPR) repeat protein